jgi:hypothetical protein
MHDRIIDRPESMESKGFFIVFYSWLHLKIRLISNYMINSFEFDRLEDFVEFLFQMMRLVSW